MIYIQVPLLKSVRAMVEVQPIDPAAKRGYLEDLDRSLAKLEQSIRDKEWPIEPHERVY